MKKFLLLMIALFLGSNLYAAASQGVPANSEPVTKEALLEKKAEYMKSFKSGLKCCAALFGLELLVAGYFIMCRDLSETQYKYLMGSVVGLGGAIGIYIGTMNALIKIKDQQIVKLVAEEQAQKEKVQTN